jgi:hypothetical protein
VTHEIAVGMRGLLGRVANLKTLDGVLNIGWSEDQMHRLAKGKEPDLDRGALRTGLALLRRNGRVSFKRRRGIA